MARELGREFKLFIVVALVGSLIGAGIVVAVKLPKNLAMKKEIEAREDEMKLQQLEIKLTDLKIPEEFAEIWKNKWYPFRPRMKQWTKEQAALFDLNPEKIGNTILEAENEELIKDIFANVP